MDRMIALLAGLIVGLRGARREALDEVVEGLRSEQQNYEWALDHASEMARKRAYEMDDAIRRAGDYQRRIGELELEIVRLGSKPSIYTWRIVVRRRVLTTHKIHSIKALREVRSGLGLLEAKQWVEGEAALTGDRTERDWVTLGDGVGPREFAMAMDTLLRATVNNHGERQPTYPEDVSFEKYEHGNLTRY